MRLPLYQVDAFADVAFAGNPAAVVLIEPASASALSDDVRQKIAAEMNLSETSFVELMPREGEPPNFRECRHFKLRWNTPAREVPLCGHATVAAAAAIFAGEGNTAETLHFQTVWSGELTVSRPEQSRLRVEMSLALESTTSELPVASFSGSDSPLLQALLGEHAGLVQEVRICSRLQYLQVVLKEGTSRRQLEAVQPDTLACLAAARKEDLVLVMITAKGVEGSEHDFLSRCFAPWAGIPEDPVTGSAHAVLGPWWAERLGKDNLRARQCSPRGGEISVAVDRAAGRVQLGGDAVIVSKGELYL